MTTYSDLTDRQRWRRSQRAPLLKIGLKEWTSDDKIDTPSKPVPGSEEWIKDPSGKLGEAGRIEAGKQEWGPKGQPKASEQLKIYEQGKKGTGPTTSQVLGAAAGVAGAYAGSATGACAISDFLF